MIKGWKLADTSDSGYTWRSREYPSLQVEINPWGGSDELLLTIFVENIVLAQSATSSGELLHDDEVLQEFLDDVNDITGSFMESFTRIMSWFKTYTNEQCVLSLLLTDSDNRDIKIMKKEYNLIDERFDELFY